jgi:hypothetical protein
MPWSRGYWRNQTMFPWICIDGWATGGRLLWAADRQIAALDAEKTLWLNELVDELRKAELKAMCVFYMHDGQDMEMVSLGEHF